MFDKLSREERRAINHFLFQVTVPILLEQGGKYALHGTGTLFSVQGECFLVTARHVIFDEDGDGQPFGQEGRRGLYCPRDLRGRSYVRIKGESVAPIGAPDPDVAFVHLRADVVQALQGRRFLDLSALLWSKDADEIAVADRYLMCGFSAELVDVQRDPGALRKPLFMATQRFSGAALEFSPPLDDRVHLIFHAPNFVTDIDTDECHSTRLPSLRGISGCSIWNWLPRADVSGLWSADKALKIIAIETGWDHSDARRWIKGTLWAAIAGTLFKELPSLGLEHLRPHLIEIMGFRPQPESTD